MARVLEHGKTALAAAALLVACGALAACGPDAGLEGASAISTSGPTINAEPTDIGAPADPPASPAVTVFFALPAADGSLQPATTASIVSARAMYVVADWAGVTADQAEQLDLLPPGGTSPYLSTSFGLAAGEDLPAQVVVLPDGTVRATYRIAIAGTSITRYQRTGTWTATVSLVGGTAAGSATIALTF